MPYVVKLSPRAEHQMRRLPRATFDRLTEAMLQLANEPRPRGSRKLVGRYPMRRLRVGAYRVVYTVLDGDQLITVDYVTRRTTTTYRQR